MEWPSWNSAEFGVRHTCMQQKRKSREAKATDRRFTTELTNCLCVDEFASELTNCLSVDEFASELTNCLSVTLSYKVPNSRCVSRQFVATCGLTKKTDATTTTTTTSHFPHLISHLMAMASNDRRTMLSVIDAGQSFMTNGNGSSVATYHYQGIRNR